MGLRVNTNIASINAQRNTAQVTGRLARIIFRGRDRQAVGDFAGQMAERARSATDRLGHAASMMGPAPAPVERIKDRYRFHLLIRADHWRAIGRLLADLQADLQPPTGVQYAIDVDPINML